MKLDIPDEYVQLIVTALEHYHAYTRAIQREDARYQEAADWFKRKRHRRPRSPSARPSGSGLKSSIPSADGVFAG